MISVKIIDPVCDIFDGCVFIAIFVQKTAVLDRETNVKNTIGDGIHEVLSEHCGCSAIVLHGMKTGFAPILIVAMQVNEFRQ